MTSEEQKKQEPKTIPPGKFKKGLESPGALDPPTDHKESDATIAPTSNPQTAKSMGLPELEDYELLEELGRGGMGVVYRARQKNLDRVVALKMILGGQFASEEAIKRFQLEAESAAKLDHPGIVPIYEIGEAAGNHFFSMKLIEGKSLADCGEAYQSDSRKAAELLMQIARAVHHAHERGVLHRDLKPANILIDTEGNPAVTDLGLAKQIGVDDGLTQTGLVMGSPGFMSPEQAAGKSDVTTSVDVYALGALLYWLVAGRAPFKGDTRLDVILQTMEAEPKCMTVFQPEADRDLNLIAQKALRKDPHERYATAAALADDIQAWLDGESLSVKAPSVVRMTQIWVRKNFRTIAWALGLGILCGLLVGSCTLSLSLYNMTGESINSFSKLGETSSPWDVRYFSWIRNIPIGLLGSLPPMMLWLNVFFGILTIAMIKPKSREVGLVAATAAALLAGIVAYTVNLGWAPIERYAINKGGNDIELIADGFWMGGPKERRLAQKSLIQRYPGLKNVDDNERGYLVFRKILHDQTLGVPKAMWVGIGTTLCLSVLPLFFAIAFSGLVWDRGHRGWAFYGQSIEVGIYSALFFLLFAKWVTPDIGTPPGFWFQVFTLSGIVLVLYFALNQMKARWRVLGFVIANVCILANFSESSMIDNASQMVVSADTDDDLRDSVVYFKKKIRNNDNSYDRFQLAIVSAYLNDDETYIDQCEGMLSSFRNIYRPLVAERLVKVCMLKPELLSEVDVERVHEIAELVSGYDSSLAKEWIYLAKGMSEMRRGNVAKAKEWSALARETVSVDQIERRDYLMAVSYIVEALACQQSADPELAAGDGLKDLLEKAAALFGEDSMSPKKGSVLDRLIYKTLLRELNGKGDVAGAESEGNENSIVEADASN